VLAGKELLRASPLFRSLAPEDIGRVAEVAHSRTYERGDVLFREGDSPDYLFEIAAGRVKLVKGVADGREVILEILGPGAPVGAVVAYEGRSYPATAVATERTVCLVLRRLDFFVLLERHPTVVRGFLSGMAQLIVQLTRRIPEVAGGRVETRFAQLFLKLCDRMGRAERGGSFIPLPLTRQELADLTGTTIETSIRIMSRWGREGVLRTEHEGFLVLDRAALGRLVHP
jgi:CRP/FNR family transcriptional regulator, nitrogen oxide reductase regulator